MKREEPWYRRLWLAIDTALGWVPVTPLGVLVAGALWAVMRINTGDQIDLIVATVGIGGLLLCLVNAPVVLAAGIWLRCRGLSASKAIPAELETGVAVATSFRVGWISWAPLFDFELAWEEPGGFDAWFEDEFLGRTGASGPVLAASMRRSFAESPSATYSAWPECASASVYRTPSDACREKPLSAVSP